MVFGKTRLTKAGKGCRNMGFGLILTFIVLFGVALVGYGLGIYKFVTCDFDHAKSSWKAEVVYGVGIVLPYNCVAGYFDIGEHDKDYVYFDGSKNNKD